MQHLLQVVLEYGGHLSSSLPQYAATTLLQKEYSSISLFLICFVFALQLISNENLKENVRNYGIQSLRNAFSV